LRFYKNKKAVFTRLFTVSPSYEMSVRTQQALIYHASNLQNATQMGGVLFCDMVTEKVLFLGYIKLRKQKGADNYGSC